MKFCERCGAQLQQGERFCSKCGTRIIESDEVNNNQAQSSNILSNQSYYTQPAAAPKKNKLGKIVPILAIVLVICMIGAFAAPFIGNTVTKTVLSSDSYFKHVVKNNMDDGTKDAVEIVSSTKEALASNEQTVTGDIELEIGEGFENLLGEFNAENVYDEIDWLEKIGLSSSLTNNDGKVSGDINLTLNKCDIVSAEAVIDGEDIYIGLPEINKQYIAVDMGQADSSMNIASMLLRGDSNEYINQIVDAIPDEKLSKKIVNRYIEIAVNQVEKVSESTETIDAAGVPQKCTALTVNIDEELANKVLLAVMENAKEDTDIKKVIQNICEVDDLDLDFDETYTSFIETLDVGIENIKDSGVGKFDEVELKVWINNTGKMIGFALSNDEFSIESITTEKGGKFGSSHKFDATGTAVIFEGAGKVSGDKRSGNFVLSYKGSETKGVAVEILEITLDKFNVEKLKEGVVTGGISLELGEDAASYLVADGAPDIIGDLKLVIDSKSFSGDKADLTMQLYSADELCATMSVKADTKGAKKVSIPKNTIDATDSDEMQAWVESAKLDKLKKNLEKAGVPSEYTEAIDELAN